MEGGESIKTTKWLFGGRLTSRPGSPPDSGAKRGRANWVPLVKKFPFKSEKVIKLLSLGGGNGGPSVWEKNPGGGGGQGAQDTSFSGSSRHLCRLYLYTVRDVWRQDWLSLPPPLTLWRPKACAPLARREATVPLASASGLQQHCVIKRKQLNLTASEGKLKGNQAWELLPATWIPPTPTTPHQNTKENNHQVKPKEKLKVPPQSQSK